MKEYVAYKKWWIKHQAPHHIPSLFWGDDAETAFREHVNQMGLYQMLETLIDWSEEE